MVKLTCCIKPKAESAEAITVETPAVVDGAVLEKKGAEEVAPVAAVEGEGEKKEETAVEGEKATEEKKEGEAVATEGEKKEEGEGEKKEGETGTEEKKEEEAAINPDAEKPTVETTEVKVEVAGESNTIAA